MLVCSQLYGPQAAFFACDSSPSIQICWYSESTSAADGTRGLLFGDPEAIASVDILATTFCKFRINAVMQLRRRKPAAGGGGGGGGA
jgi:hypothetical protein